MERGVVFVILDTQGKAIIQYSSYSGSLIFNTSKLCWHSSGSLFNYN